MNELLTGLNGGSVPTLELIYLLTLVALHAHCISRKRQDDDDPRKRSHHNDNRREQRHQSE